jgi:hypothetical protein
MPSQTGPVSQRDLVPLLNGLIDAAMAKNSTAHRDIARSKLRELLSDPAVNWRTSFVLNNVGATRSRYVASIGFWVPSKWLLVDWKRRPGEDKADAEG